MKQLATWKLINDSPVKIIVPLFFVFAFFVKANAQVTINGTVFIDGNNNGIKDSGGTTNQTASQPKDVGYPYVIVKAFTASGATQAAIATTGADGTYSLTGLTSGTQYRIEFTVPAGFYEGAYGSGSGTSVQFVTAPATNLNFGLFTPGKCGSDPDPVLVGACALPAAGSTDPTVVSWRYTSDFYWQDHWGSNSSLLNSSIQPHNADISASIVGVPWALARIVNSKYIAIAPISSPLTSVFGTGGSAGTTAIYLADYSGANTTYSSTKTLVNLASLGLSFAATHPIGTTQPRFGEYGIGGIANSADGKYLYIANLGKGNIIRLDISGVNYTSLPATAPTASNVTEIALPATYAGFISGTDGYFRPTSLLRYAGDIYVGGTFDGSLRSDNSAVRVVVLKLNTATNTFTEVFNYDPVLFKVGSMSSQDVSQTRWTAGPDPSGKTIPLQPVVSGLTFDDYGALIIGVSSRAVYNNQSENQTGYVVTTWKNSNGTFTLESNGTRGPLTTFMAGSYTHQQTSSTASGPGGNIFLDQSMGEPYLYNGGVLNMQGRNSVAMGLSDPITNGSFGVRYDRPSDGRIIGGINLGELNSLLLSGWRMSVIRTRSK